MANFNKYLPPILKKRHPKDITFHKQMLTPNL